MSDSRPPKNVINLKDRRQTLKRKAEPQKKGVKAGRTSGGNISWTHYLQFFLFIGLLAYFMRTCSG